MAGERKSAGRKSIGQSDVLSAARRCFRRYGVKRTSMSDVADEMSISRQTVYRVFENRSDLLEAIASELIIKMGGKLMKPFAQFDNLQEALVEGSLLSIAEGATDPLFAEILEESDNHQFDQFLFKGSDEVHAIMLTLWGPLLDQARNQNLLRSELSNEFAVEWIRNVHAMAAIRTDYSRDQQRSMFQTFLVPSLLRN